MVDLRTCKRVDKLLTAHGNIMTYISPTPVGNYYDHFVQHSDGSFETRVHDGHVARYALNRLGTDEDIVAVLTENEALARQQMKNMP